MAKYFHFDCWGLLKSWFISNQWEKLSLYLEVTIVLTAGHPDTAHMECSNMWVNTFCPSFCFQRRYCKKICANTLWPEIHLWVNYWSFQKISQFHFLKTNYIKNSQLVGKYDDCFLALQIRLTFTDGRHMTFTTIFLFLYYTLTLVLYYCKNSKTTITKRKT